MKIAKLIVLVWAVKYFTFADSVTGFLNTLPPERAVEAKVTCWNYDCAVYYRIEKAK